MELERNIRRVAGLAAAAAAGYAAARLAAHGVSKALQEIDDALNIDFGDWEDPACECGGIHAPSQVVSVTAGAILHNGEFGPMPITAEFFYIKDDPMAVGMRLTLDIELGSGRVVHDSQTWVYARDLIDTAMSLGDNTEVGEGDVTVRYNPEREALSVRLTDVDGDKHQVDIDPLPVAQFMAASLALVPAHEEHADVDTAIARLLDGTWEQRQ